ncbi:MAG: hypothetical protein JW384_01721 [Nitrosomonadaceae bacterium]|nr:hypothetical protein [Nitrosomonadaceae bacterium]
MSGITHQSMKKLKRQSRALADAAFLLEDAYWKKLVGDAPEHVRTYAYYVLSGLTREEAVVTICNLRDRDIPTGRAMERITRWYDRASQPIFAKAQIESGISPFWMMKVVRSIGDDIDQPGSVRLAAVDLAGKLSGAFEERQTQTTVTREIATGQATVIREQVSQTIRSIVGNVVTIPRMEAEPEPDIIIEGEPLKETDPTHLIRNFTPPPQLIVSR